MDHITSDELKPKEILQSSFDLLGELMKFNPFAFKRFDQVISDKQVSKCDLIAFVLILLWCLFGDSGDVKSLNADVSVLVKW